MYSLTNPPSRETIEDFEAMSIYDNCMEMNARIYKARKDAGFTQDELAAAVGKTRGAVAQWESGEVRPRHSTLVAIANATGKPVLWVESGIGDELSGLLVVGEVAAGTWREGSVEYKPYGVPVAPHPDYPTDAQRLYQVRGNSVNRSVRDGEYIHCVSVQSGAVTPEHGDLVVVCRKEHGKYEYTAKRLSVKAGKQILRPDSDDPLWQEDIALDGNDDTDIEIVDVVIAKWQPISRLR